MITQDSNLKFLKAKSKVKKIKKFYNHLAVYIIVNIIITGFKMFNSLDNWNNFTNELLSIEVLSSWVIWGMVLLIHFISVVFFHDWEERKIDAYMKKEEESKRWN